jgi:hypothetical protein
MTALPTVSSISLSPTAPLQLELRFIVKKPPQQVFELVALRLDEWFTAIHAVSWDHSRSTEPGTAGACSERACDFAGKQLFETIVEWEPGLPRNTRADTMFCPIAGTSSCQGASCNERNIDSEGAPQG